MIPALLVDSGVDSTDTSLGGDAAAEIAADGTATFKVRNLETGVDAPDVTHTTNLPAGAVLHVAVLANNGGVGTCGLDVAYIAVGMPA